MYSKRFQIMMIVAIVLFSWAASSIAASKWTSIGEWKDFQGDHWKQTIRIFKKSHAPKNAKAGFILSPMPFGPAGASVLLSAGSRYFIKKFTSRAPTLMMCPVLTTEVGRPSVAAYFSILSGSALRQSALAFSCRNLCQKVELLRDKYEFAVIDLRMTLLDPAFKIAGIQ